MRIRMQGRKFLPSINQIATGKISKEQLFDSQYSGKSRVINKRGVTPSPSKNGNHHSEHFEKMVQNFNYLTQSYLNHMTEGGNLGMSKHLQPRDRRVIFPYRYTDKTSFNLQEQEQKLEQWLGQMHFTVVSSAFDLLLSKQLSYDECKVFCSENLILNLLKFYEQVDSADTYDVTKKIDSILRKNLTYMLSKYPQTKQVKANKKLRQSIFTLNNLDNDEIDILSKSGVDFKLNNSQDYTKQIMQFVNYLITKQTEVPNKFQNKNYYQLFYEAMEGIFQSVEYSHNEANQRKEVMNLLALIEQKRDAASKKVSQSQNQQAKRKQRQAKQYRDKVRSYTSYKIDQKLKPNTPLFTSNQIETGQFSVKSTAVLRILAKWIEQLEKKIRKAEDSILKRLFRFKNRNKGYIKLNSGQKNQLYQEAQKKIHSMNKILDEIQESCFQIQGTIARSALQGPKNIPKNQLMVGNFSSKIESAASSYLFSYLNKIIHYLLQIPDDVMRKYADNEFMVDDMNINLVTFKVGDLFRCKCSSHEFQILRIFNKIKQMSEEGDVLKIVRIKDRLEMGTRDILINILFMNTFICQIQLAVVDEINQKQNLYDKFNHFLYELKRSNLGSVMQSACIWAHLDQRSSRFKGDGKLSQNTCTITRKRDHKCPFENMQQYSLAFVCSLCGEFYPSQSGLFKNRKCMKCKKFYQCRSCFENKMDQNQLKNFLGIDQALGFFADDFVQWFPYSGKKPPKFGIIISRKMKTVRVKFFNVLTLKNVDQVVTINAKGDAEVITTFKHNQNDWDKLARDFIILQWKENRHFNKTTYIYRNQEQAKKRQAQIRARARMKMSEPLQKDKLFQPSDYEQVLQPFVFKQSASNSIGEVRVANKVVNGKQYLLFLEKYYPQKQLKSKIRAEFNLNAIQTMLRNKMEVLFYEEEGMNNQLNQLCHNELSDSLLNIKEIYLDENVIEDISFLKHTPILEVAHLSKFIQIFLDRNNIKSIEPIKGLKNLVELMLENNNITVIQGLDECVRLNELSLNSNKIKQISGLDNLVSLEILNLYKNKIVDIQGLNSLKNLLSLDLSYNQITQIKNFENLIRLEELDLCANFIRKIEGLDKLKNLRHIQLASNKIYEIQGLQNLKQLRDLQLSDNYISRLMNLNELQNLAKLLVNKNEIQKIQGIDNLQKLKVFQASENEIRVLQNLKYLFELTRIDLSANWIMKASYQEIEPLKKLKFCDLDDNPIGRDQQTLDQVHKIRVHIAGNDMNIEMVKKVSNNNLSSLQKI